MTDPERFPLFRLFTPDEYRLGVFSQKLMEEYLYMSDEHRNPNAILVILAAILGNPRKNVIYEIGDFDGILGFTDILPGWKAILAFKLWNKKLWGADFVRQAKDFIHHVMKELYLVRLETATADPRIIKMAKMVGFEVEGVCKKGFSWKGQLYDNTQLAIVKEK